MRWAKQKALLRLTLAFERRFIFIKKEASQLHEELSRPFQKLFYSKWNEKGRKLFLAKTHVNKNWRLFGDKGKKYIPSLNSPAVLENIKNLALVD